MKTSSRGGGNELQIAATFEPRVIKESKLIKQKNPIKIANYVYTCLQKEKIERLVINASY